MKNKKFEPRKRKPIREIETRKKYDGESSPYWDFMQDKAARSGEALTNEFIEDTLANPDRLSEDESLYNRPLTEVGKIQIEAVKETLSSLSARERTIFETVAAEGRTLAYTSGLLGISISTVQTVLNRVRSKIKRRFDALMAAEN